MTNNKENFVCDLCGSELFKVKQTYSKRLSLLDTPYDVIKCKNCGLLRLYPIPREDDFKDIYEDYSEKYERLRVEKIRLNRIYPEKLQKLKRYAKGKRLLDIGAGLGAFVYAARKAGFDAVGVEFNKDQCIRAKELWGIDLVQGMIEDHHKDLGKFDVINLHHVLEHVHSPKDIFEIIYKLLDDNGVCLIEVPNQFYNINKEIRRPFSKRKKSPANKLHHLTFFSVRTLKIYIKRQKFEILKINQFRDNLNNDSFTKRKFKKLYRKFINVTQISGGNFIEVFLRKHS